MSMKMRVYRGAMLCGCGQMKPRDCGFDARCPDCELTYSAWTDEAEDFPIEVEVEAKWVKPNRGAFDKGGGCIDPPHGGYWEDMEAWVGKHRFPLTDTEEDAVQDEAAYEACEDYEADRAYDAWKDARED